MRPGPHRVSVHRTERGIKLLALSRGAVALVIVMALVAQIEDQIVQGTFNPGTYFAYFSIQTSIANALALCVSAVTTFFVDRLPRSFSFIKGSLVAYAIVTAAVYNLLLRDNVADSEAPALLDWPIETTHVWVPLYLIVEWTLNPSRQRLSLLFLGWGLVYPAIWIVGTMTRGALTGWYPYDFFDPSGPAGWVGVAGYTVAIGGLCLASLGLALLINRWRHPATAKSAA